MPGVLTGDEVGFGEDANGAVGDVLQVADGRGDEVEGHCDDYGKKHFIAEPPRRRGKANQSQNLKAPRERALRRADYQTLRGGGPCQASFFPRRLDVSAARIRIAALPNGSMLCGGFGSEREAGVGRLVIEDHTGGEFADGGGVLEAVAGAASDEEDAGAFGVAVD